MPVSVICSSAATTATTTTDSSTAAAAVSAALRDSIAGSATNCVSAATTSAGATTSAIGKNFTDDSQTSLQGKLVASTKRVLLTKIDYEEVENYSQSVLDNLKSKYIVLKPHLPSNGISLPPSGNSTTTTTSSEVNGGKSNSQSSVGSSSVVSITGSNNNHQQNSISTSSAATPASSHQNSLNSVGQQNGSKDGTQLPHPKRILFQRENVQIGWKNFGRKWQVGSGMINVGNTCYLNSTLQALFHVPAIANWLISDQAHREKCEDENGSQGGCIICAMSKTLISSQMNQSAIKPFLVYSKLRLVCKHLIMGRQEDSHEFLRYLVEAMEKSYLSRFRNSKELDQYSKETTPLNQILGGYLKSAVRCLSCGHISTTFQHFEDLLLDIRKANSVEEALEGYFARERLEDMGYKCEACKKKVSATKQFSLERAPISLCVQLKRFSMMGTKLTKHVAIRPRLDLTPYSSKKNGSLDKQHLTYKLVAMVTHLGASQHCGHYTAIGLAENGSFYQFDDSCVRPISLQHVLNTNAYIIFYELENSQQNSKQTSTQISREYEQVKENFQKLQNGHNSSILAQQQKYPSTSTNSNAPATSFFNLNPKSLNNLDNKNSVNAFIGPQLPVDKSETNGFMKTTVAVNTNTTNGGGAVFQGSKLVNSSNSKIIKLNNNNNLPLFRTHQFQSPNQKTNQSLDNKIVIHMKNTSNGGCVKTIYNVPFSSTTAAAKSPEKVKSCNDETNSTLPSMPKLDTTLPTTSSSLNREKPIVTISNVSSNYSKQVSQIPIKTLTNGHVKHQTVTKTDRETSSNNHIVSLVPYGSDDDSTDGSDAKQKFDNGVDRRHTNGNFKHSNGHNSTNDDLSHSFDNQTSQRTTPSPPVIKSKTGLWQVTNLLSTTPPPPPPPFIKIKGKRSATSPPPTFAAKKEVTAATAVNSERRNPFATGTPTTISSASFYSPKSNEKKFNGNRTNGIITKVNAEKNEIVSHLIKFGHRGYGAPILTWNGQKASIEKEIHEEKLQNRKRELDDEDEMDMDRGRQKKIKTYHQQQGRDNPDYNPFQEYQSAQFQHNNNNNNNSNNHQNRRNWIHNNNDRYYNGGGGNNYRQNNNHNHRNQNNNFRRNRFHQRPYHHQRQGNGGGFHQHRRDS